jgi:hypothetical protein
MDALKLAKEVKPLGLAYPAASQPIQAPLEQTAQRENIQGTIVSPYRGSKVGVVGEAGLNPSIQSDDDLKTWSPSTPNLIGAPVPLLFNIQRGLLHVRKIFQSMPKKSSMIVGFKILFMD